MKRKDERNLTTSIMAGFSIVCLLLSIILPLALNEPREVKWELFGYPFAFAIIMALASVLNILLYKKQEQNDKNDTMKDNIEFYIEKEKENEKHKDNEKE